MYYCNCKHYDGTITVNGGVETFTVQRSRLSGTMSDVVTVDIKGVLDPNSTTDKVVLHLILMESWSSNPVIDGASVDVQNNGNIETLTAKPTTVINNGDLDIDNNSDFETVTVTGARVVS